MKLLRTDEIVFLMAALENLHFLEGDGIGGEGSVRVRIVRMILSEGKRVVLSESYISAVVKVS